MVRGDDDWAFGRDVSKTFNLGSKGAHQKWRQECTQYAVGEVVEHRSNLPVIAPYDTI